jgi:hypothetical protein
MVHPATEAAALPPDESPSGSPSGPPPRTVLLIGGVILLAIVLMAMVATVLLRGGLGWPGWFGRSGPARVDHVVTGPALDGRTHVQFDLVKGATAVTVRGAPLGDRIYRVTGSADGDHAPTVADNGNVVQVTGVGNSSAVVVELNTSVTWTLRLVDGATSETLDLHDLKLARVEIIGGVSSIDLRLPAPHGSVPVRMTGGANSFAIHRPSGEPVRVRAGGGASSVTIDGDQHSGVSGGSTFASNGWDAAGDKYDVDCTTGVSAVTVDQS